MPPVLAEFFQALSAWPAAAFLRGSTATYAALNATHILAIGLVVGSIATLDLKVLGAFRAAPLAALAGPLSKMAAAGVTLAVASGLLLFSVRPGAYAENPAFLAKLTLVALGVANALILRASGAWRLAVRDGGWVTGRVRLQAALSLLIWAAAVLAGRWIGFLQ